MNMKMKIRNKKGFSLPEVLAALVVMGIVAALTIPTFFSSTNQEEYKTNFKKAMGNLNKAIGMSIAEESIDASVPSTVAELTDIFIKRFDVIDREGDNIFFTSDGVKYTFTKNGRCGTTNTIDIATAECYILLDLNNDYDPNQLSTNEADGTPVYKDRYYVVVKKNAVVPAIENGHDVAIRAISE